MSKGGGAGRYLPETYTETECPTSNNLIVYMKKRIMVINLSLTREDNIKLLEKC